jgi:predicted transcriptional regulator
VKRRRASGQPTSRAAYWKTLRVALGIRVETVAKITGFSTGYLCAIECGARPLLPHVEDTLRVAFDREQKRVYADAVRLEAAA